MYFLDSPVPPYVSRVIHEAQKLSTCLHEHVGAAIVHRESFQVVTVGFNYSPCEKRCVKFDGLSCPATPAEVIVVQSFRSQKMVKPKAYHIVTSHKPQKPILDFLDNEGFESLIVLPPPLGDASVFEKIREYHQHLGYPSMDEEQKYQQAREILLALHVEVSELANSIQWKPWNHVQEFTRHNLKEECADILIFLDSFLSNFDIEWPEEFEAILEKLETLKERS